MLRLLCYIRRPASASASDWLGAPREAVPVVGGAPCKVLDYTRLDYTRLYDSMLYYD